jgi:small-conductance mechanosensitive channel
MNAIFYDLGRYAMQLQFTSGSPLVEAAWAVGILLISILLAWFVHLAIRWGERKLKARSQATLPSQLLRSFSRPIIFILILEGTLQGLSSVSYLAGWITAIGTVRIAALIVLVTYILANSGGVLLTWYLRGRRARKKARVDDSLINLLRRFMVIVIYAIGIMVMLDYLQLNITPLIASLGIGGLAIALALQPTLGNFFAGTQIVSDHVVRTGDYVELDNGEIKGYVTDVGWRSTRIRTPFNNIITIPNSHLADSVLTNFHSPNTELGVMVNCGVSYSSDLVQVENISLEVAREVVKELDEAVKTFEPIFRYDEFGDSNINFWIWLQALDRMASFRLKSELIKRLKARFDREGITINYPARYLTIDRHSGIQDFFPSDKPEPGSYKKKV